jgi:hypothetical protein
MKIVVRAFLVFVSASLGLAFGIIWNAGLSSRSKTTLISTSETGQRNQTKVAPKAARQRPDDSALATRLEHDLSVSSGVRKWLCWMAALEKAQPADFPRLAKLAHGNPTIWHAVVNHWIQIAPRNLFDRLAHDSQLGDGLPVSELGRTLFDQWPKSDPEGAIAALDQAAEVGLRDAWRAQVASAIVEKDAERGLRLMSQWHIENYGPRMTAVDAWAAANPQHAAEFVLANPAGFASQEAMDSVGRAWAKIDPAAALAFAGSQSGALITQLASTVLKQWAEQNLPDAADWLAATDEHTRAQLSPAFVETWAKQDAAAALYWCEGNLQGPQLTRAVGGVIKGAAEKDVSGAAAMVAGMQPGPVRTEAAGVVAQNWFPRSFSSESVKPEALSWLSSLDPESIRGTLSRISWSWAESDPRSLATFLASAGNNEVPSYADSTLAREWARTSPTDALAWAASLPQPRGLSAGGDAFSVWHQSQPEAAMAWLDGLPADDPRQQPFFESMVRSLAYGPQAAEHFASMSDADRATAQAVIAKMSLPDDQRAKLMESLKPQ